MLAFPLSFLHALQVQAFLPIPIQSYHSFLQHVYPEKNVLDEGKDSIKKDISRQLSNSSQRGQQQLIKFLINHLGCIMDAIHELQQEQKANFDQLHPENNPNLIIHLMYQLTKTNYMFNIKYHTFYKQKMQQQELKIILKGILESNQKSADVAGEEEIVTNLVAKLKEDHLIGFAAYLDKECGLSPGVILQIADKLMTNPRVQSLLGAKIIRLWLLFKSFEAMDILRANDPTQKEKRIKLTNLFIAFAFPGSNLEAFLRNSCKTIGEGEEYIGDMASIISEKRDQFISQAFKRSEPSPPPSVQKSVYNPEKSNMEQLQDLISDYRQMPENTFIQYLMAATILSFVEKDSEARNRLSSIKPPLPFNKLTADIVTILRKSYQKDNPVTSIEWESSFKKITQKMNQKIADVYGELRALQTKVFSIDVFELERLINKTQKSKEMIREKDVLLMIGNTGSGKSTNILKFLGYDLIPGKIDKLPTLLLTRQPEQAHKSFYTSPEAKSCTRYINAVPIPDKMYKLGTSENKKTLVICDSPGFGDSAGVQVDIANGIGMINALYGARSVRVVVILPYDSLTGERMAGAFKMSQIIADLFHDLTVLESIAIYFNKVPNDKIDQLPHLIQNKLENLTLNQKSFEKHNSFLKQIHNRAGDKDNFIDPLNSDYRALFQKLMDLKPITKVSKTFRYDFATETKKQIEKYLLVEKSRIIQHFMCKRYEESAYHFMIIQKFHESLPNHNNVKETHKEIIRFIQDEIEKMLTILDSQINQIVSCKQTLKTSEKISESKEKIKKITEIFGKYQSLRICPTKIHELISRNKDIILAQFQDITKVTLQVIQSAKSFSELLQSRLKSIVLNKIEERFNQYHFVVITQVSLRRYPEMMNNLTTMSKIAKFWSELTSTTDNSITKQLEQIKENFRTEVQGCLQQVNNLVFSGNSVIGQSDLSKIQRNLSQIKAIESLNFLGKEDQIASQLSSTLRKINKKCRSMIRQLLDIKLSLDEDIGNSKPFDSKELINKKKQIQLLMNIESVRDQLSEDYNQSRQSLKRQLTKNAGILQSYLESLKGNKVEGNKVEEYLNNIHEITKASKIVLQCYSIVEGAQDNQELTKKIQDSFQKYIQEDIDKIRLFDVKQLNEQSIAKICFQRKKIESFRKMSFLGPKIAASVKELKKQFGEKIRAPLKSFLKSDAAKIQDKKHHRSIPYSLNKLENLSFYIFKIKDILENDHDQLSKLREDQSAIKEKMKEAYNSIEQETLSFQDLQFQHKNYPIYLKELIRVLLKIDQKRFYSQYLTHQQILQAGEKLNIIKYKLHNIQKQLQARFNNYQNSNLQLESMQDLIVDCKFYSDIEETLKNEDFGFKKLLQKCSVVFKHHLANEQDKIKHIISDNKPSKIDYPEIKQLYNKFVDMKSKDGDQKRRLIVDLFRNKEQETLANLGGYNIVNDKELDHINQDSKYHDFMENFQETMILVDRIKHLYTQEGDKAYIIIDQGKLQKICSNIIHIFKRLFFNIENQLKSYNINPFTYKSLRSFKIIQEKLIDIFKMELQDQLYDDVQRSIVDTRDHFNQSQASLKKFIQDNTTRLRQQLYQNQFAIKTQIANARTISDLLSILKDYTIKQIDLKYKEFSPSFKVDEGFEKFYLVCAKQGQEKLQENVRMRMNQLFQNLEQNFNISAVQMQKVRLEITQTIHFLPPGLKNKYKLEHQQLNKRLIQDFQGLIKNISKDIFTNHMSLQKYFSEAQKARKCGQTNIHKVIIETLQELYTSEQQKMSNMSTSQKIAFIHNSFINLYYSHKAQLNEDLLILNVIKQKFKLCLRILKKQGEKLFYELEGFLNRNSPIGVNTQQEDINYLKPINEIFEILHFFCHQISTEAIEDTSNSQNQMLATYEKAISKLFKAHQEILQDKPAYKLHSTDILERVPMGKVQDYVRNVSLSQSILRIFQTQIQRFMNNQKNGKKYFQSIPEVVAFQPSALKVYLEEIDEIIKKVSSFEFYTSFKRNMSSKEIQQQLSKMDLCYQILNSRVKFFKKLSNQKEIDFHSISACLENKLNVFFNDAFQEIKAIFSPQSKAEEGMLNFLIKTLKIVRQRENQFKFLPATKAYEINASLSKEIKVNFQKLTEQFSRYINKAREELKQGKKYQATDVETLAKVLFIYQKALLDIQDSQNYKIELDKMLSNLQKSPELATAIQLQLKNRKDDVRSIGKSFRIKKLLEDQQITPNAEQATKMMQAILKGNKSLQMDEGKELRKAVDMFIGNYEHHIKNFKNCIEDLKEKTIHSLVTTLKDLGKQLNEEFYQTSNPLKGQKDKINLLSGVLSLFAIIKYRLVLKPYITQIFAMISLLGITADEEALGKRLAQIPPGEGKSLVLACINTYLALVGFKIRCLCYNRYLTNRHYSSFKDVYEKLGLERQIKYVTIEDLCLEQLRENTPNFVKATTTLLASDSNGPNIEVIRQEVIPTILVVDDIGIFFEEDYYGKTFSPRITLRDNQVSDLFKFVWEQVKKTGKETSPQKIIESQQFRNICLRYPNLAGQLRKQVSGMINDAVKHHHNYKIQDKRIVYPKSRQFFHGYKTVFAHFYQIQQQRILGTTIDKVLQINIIVGQFSYGSLLTSFEHVLGVSGTFNTSAQFYQRQLQKVITDLYIMPSVYSGRPKMVQEYIITSNQTFNSRLIDKINSVKDKRPIIIFFRDLAQLGEFKGSKAFDAIANKVSIVSEGQENASKQFNVQKTVTPGSITLMLSSFGRGIDFQILNEDLKQSGGLHIIQTFLSLDEGEELQIKARAARKMCRGSYDCVVSESQLDMQRLQDFSDHEKIAQYRRSRIYDLKETRTKMMQEAAQKHQKMKKVYQQYNDTIQRLNEYVSDLNQCNQCAASREVTVRVIIGIDASYAMEKALNKIISCFIPIFKQTNHILNKSKANVTVEIKVIAYRDYTSPWEQIIESSNFQRTPSNICSFLQGLKCQRNWGNNVAVEVLLQAANKEQDIDQVILIGNAGPNNPDQIRRKRQKQKGESYWDSNGFPITNLSEELNKLQQRQCPVHSCYLRGSKTGFYSISDSTGGIAAQFQIHPKEFEPDLIDFIVERLLYQIQLKIKDSNLKLVQAYMKSKKKM